MMVITNINLLEKNTMSKRQARLTYDAIAGSEVWVSKGDSDSTLGGGSVVVVVNSGTKATTVPDIKIADVGFVPHLGNKIQVTKDILTATPQKQPLITVTSYDMSIQYGTTSIPAGTVEVYAVHETYIYETNLKMNFKIKLLIIFLVGFIFALCCYYKNQDEIYTVANNL